MLPPDSTVERWAWDYVHAATLAEKLAPKAPPGEWERDAPSRRLAKPARPPELRVVARAEKTRGLGAAPGRARALHTFMHHELQAAELMAWAILAFPTAPLAFREGLLRIATDEIRHMNLYGAELAARGVRYGEHPVRDWFWERVPSAETPLAFVSIMGLGVESANLEHTASYAARFREAGDEAGAALQERVGREEIAHVRFGAQWFEHFAGRFTFDAWQAALPPPLTPLLMRGAPMQRDARLAAGQPKEFLDQLESWQPETTTIDRPRGS